MNTGTCQTSVLRLSILVAAIALGGCASQSHVSLAGDWTLDLQLSRFGAVEVPVSGRLIVEERGDLRRMRLEKHTKGKEAVSQTLEFRVDGVPLATRMQPADGPETDVTTRGKWSGERLVVSYDINHLGHVDRFVDTWSMSDGGRILTRRRDITLPDRLGHNYDVEVTEVFRRGSR